MTKREKVLRNLGVPPQLSHHASEGPRHERLAALRRAGTEAHRPEVYRGGPTPSQ